MRISELSDLTGVSTATIKYYTRAGVLPPGVRRNATQVEYTEEHVTRLRLIRHLIEIGGLSIADIATLTNATTDHNYALGPIFRAAQLAVTQGDHQPSEASKGDVMELIEQRGWAAREDNPGVAQVAAALDVYREIGLDIESVLGPFAEAAEAVAHQEVEYVMTAGTPERMAEIVAIGTILGDSLLAGLRRIAHESISRLRFGVSDLPGSNAHPPAPEAAT